MSNIPKPIDGAVVVSNNERDVDCVVTFQTESILEQFMIRFEDLKIDCNDKLVIYDGAHAIGKFMVSSFSYRISILSDDYNFRPKSLIISILKF